MNKKTKFAINPIVLSVAFMMLMPCGCKDYSIKTIKTIKTISVSEAESLVGLSTAQIREQLGKPDNVHFPTRFSTSKADEIVEETWKYYSLVDHTASGTKRGLACRIQDGKCVGVRMY